MGCVTVMRRIGALVTLLAGFILGAWANSECPSEWEFDEQHDRCLWLSKTELDYDSALMECKGKGGSLTTLDHVEDIDALEKLSYSGEGPISFWTEYLLVRHGPRYRLFDGAGTEVELSSCDQCQSLLNQSTHVRHQEVSRACAHVTVNASVTWTIAGCGKEHSYVCQRLQDSKDKSLAPRDIAAITVGALVLLSFFVTLIIDFYLHVKREKRKYLESTKPDLEQKKDSPLDFSVSNFGSKAELIPTDASSSHV